LRTLMCGWCRPPPFRLFCSLRNQNLHGGLDVFHGKIFFRALYFLVQSVPRPWKDIVPLGLSLPPSLGFPLLFFFLRLGPSSQKMLYQYSGLLSPMSFPGFPLSRVGSAVQPFLPFGGKLFFPGPQGFSVTRSLLRVLFFLPSFLPKGFLRR